MLTEAQTVEIFKAEFAKYNQNHDDKGRFTSADSQAAGAASEAASRAGVRDSHPQAGLIKRAFHALASVAHDKATRLASAVKDLVTSTRLASVAPVANGGVEISTRHTTGSGGVIHSTVQVHPFHVSGNPTAARALQAAHSALVFAGHRNVAVKRPAVSATFSRT